MFPDLIRDRIKTNFMDRGDILFPTKGAIGHRGFAIPD